MCSLTDVLVTQRIKVVIVVVQNQTAFWQLDENTSTKLLVPWIVAQDEKMYTLDETWCTK